MYEEWQKAIEKRMDALELRTTMNERDIQDINKKLDKIESNTGKIIWMIISTVAVYVITASLKGGF